VRPDTEFSEQRRRNDGIDSSGVHQETKLDRPLRSCGVGNMQVYVSQAHEYARDSSVVRAAETVKRPLHFGYPRSRRVFRESKRIGGSTQCEYKGRGFPQPGKTLRKMRGTSRLRENPYITSVCSVPVESGPATPVLGGCQLAVFSQRTTQDSSTS